MPHKKMQPELSLHDFSLQVHLGCTAQERATPQEVRLSVKVRFLEAPPGEISDALDHTVCYAEICQVLRESIELKTFNLVEKIAADGFNSIKKINPQALFKLKVSKVRPPIQGLLGGVDYLCGDAWE